MDAQKVGKSIAFLRCQYGMTQRDLAARLGVTDKAVSRWERGLGVPDVSLLTNLSVVLDADIESLLAGNLTHFGLKWKGILALNYPDGISPLTPLFGKCSVELQMSYFMLTGIQEICIRGIESDIACVKEKLQSGEQYGIKLKYETAYESNLAKSTDSEYFKEYRRENGVMLIDGLSFLYGKDLTKMFRNIMYDSKGTVRLANSQNTILPVSFYPHTVSEQEKTIEFPRGFTAFPILNQNDILDASNIVSLLEKHTGEKIGDLAEIAKRRGFIS